MLLHTYPVLLLFFQRLSQGTFPLGLEKPPSRNRKWAQSRDRHLGGRTNLKTASRLALMAAPRGDSSFAGTPGFPCIPSLLAWLLSGEQGGQLPVSCDRELPASSLDARKHCRHLTADDVNVGQRPCSLLATKPGSDGKGLHGPHPWIFLDAFGNALAEVVSQ